MKNLMIYLHPSKQFINTDWGNETELLVKIQIDNSIELGWDRKDIVLVTNFEYEYNGVRSLVVGDYNYCEHSSGTPSKINAIVTLFKRGLIEDDLYWFHDFDAFQLDKLDVDIERDQIALTDYGVTVVSKDRNGRWSTGSIFFRNGSCDVFEWIQTAMYKYGANEEVSLLALTRHDKHGICSRVKKLNVTYNFATRKRNIGEQYKITDLPLKVIHFHPLDKRPVFYLYKGEDNISVCVHGKNPMNKPLVSETLIKIFKKYNIG